MRDIPSAFTGGAMTLARCWRLTRRDGTQMGFTDHDVDLVLDTVTYSARTGLSASDFTSTSGLEVTGGDIQGALSSSGLTEADIAAGLYDQARIDLYLVDWTQPRIRILIESGMIGEIRRSGVEFTCEMRSIASLYQEEKGRLYQRNCSAELGDKSCGIDLKQERFRFEGEVLATDQARYFEVAASPDQFDFTGGNVIITAIGQSALTFGVKAHIGRNGRSGIWLWQDPPRPIAVGDPVTLVQGCDKSFETCAQVFANQKNFRGFPHMPGADFIVRVAKDGEARMDGGSLFT